MEISLNQLLIFSCLLRLCLVVYGEVQDAYSFIKYTDVDYLVFSDAARHVFVGDSPYKRLTYRYTPLLAILLQPNCYLPSFGKLIFVGGDIVIGYLIYKILSGTCKHHTSLTGAALWLLNPIAAGVSTRGNAESLLGAVILTSLHLTKQNKPFAAGAALSLAVHLKIYPILYSLPLYLYLAYCSPPPHSFLNLRTAKFVSSFLLVQTTLLTVLYMRYGWEFLHESYLYHITRVDTRHNFSPYFYLLYLSRYVSPGTGLLGSLLQLLTFLPQLTLSLLLPLSYYHLPELCLTLQTITFVIFNKVCTAQYFLWYLWLVPLLLPSLRLSAREAGALAGVWLAGQGLWLGTGYLVEFTGYNAFLLMHSASLLFLLSQAGVVCVIIRSFRMSGTERATLRTSG